MSCPPNQSGKRDVYAQIGFDGLDLLSVGRWLAHTEKCIRSIRASCPNSFYPCLDLRSLSEKVALAGQRKLKSPIAVFFEYPPASINVLPAVCLYRQSRVKVAYGFSMPSRTATSPPSVSILINEL